MLGKIVAVSSIAAAILLVVLLQATRPAEAGPLGILAVFILMYMSVLGVLTFFMYALSRLIVKISGAVTVRRPLQPLTFSRAYYFASAISLAPVIIIGMQSVGEVGIYDVLLVALFVSIACFYIAKRTN